ncbi:uncharacterized protein C8Q71DRAFT_751769 [Rhodofomes roseus]|uniref:Uncharacterized protein n=1 Tax=Rhodofomes roseus TaxID=34475 RepID=A0ABQ8KKQ9_9APHY|nr:uncharacterized protein C8Q71DRAFT_751769 [Rhodofomes roseus]KAH9838544.1 hypothetical protein C8Q71DRAFT_751769 [Rhodofomes roseus]
MTRRASTTAGIAHKRTVAHHVYTRLRLLSTGSLGRHRHVGLISKASGGLRCIQTATRSSTTSRAVRLHCNVLAFGGSSLQWSIQRRVRYLWHYGLQIRRVQHQRGSSSGQPPFHHPIQCVDSIRSSGRAEALGDGLERDDGHDEHDPRQDVDIGPILHSAVQTSSSPISASSTSSAKPSNIGSVSSGAATSGGRHLNPGDIADLAIGCAACLFIDHLLGHHSFSAVAPTCEK